MGAVREVAEEAGIAVSSSEATLLPSVTVPVTDESVAKQVLRGLRAADAKRVARLALAQGADEILLTTRADNQAVLPMVMAAGLRGRIRMSGDELSVRVPLRDLEATRR